MYDTPQAFFERPRSRRVAEFFGGANFIPAAANGASENGCVDTALGPLRVSSPAPEGGFTLTIRPEAVRLEAGENSFAARVASASYLGRHKLCSLHAGGIGLSAALAPDAEVAEGEEVNVRLPASALWPLQE